MARPKNTKRPLHKDYTCSEDESYNLEILMNYYNTVGARIYPARVINHLVYDECVRLGLAPKPCVEETLIREKEVKPKRVKKFKEPKKFTKKQLAEKKLEEKLEEILGI